MRKFIFILTSLIVGLYLVLYIVVSSSAVQKRLLGEIQSALAKAGFDLEVESIEFAAFSPKLYLNRVTIRSNKDAEIPLDVPLTIDKIKVQIQPLALLSRKLVIHEALLFNPKILIPRADTLVRKVEHYLKSPNRVELEGGSLTIVVRKVGIVDAHFNVNSRDPELSVRSTSLTVTMLNEGGGSRNISVTTRDLGLDRGKLSLLLSEVDLDVELTADRLKLNRGMVQGEDLFMQVNGDATLPIKLDSKQKNSVYNAAFDFSIPLKLLNKIPELKAPELAGMLSAQGTVHFNKGNYNGDGELKYSGVKVDDYPVESGRFSFSMKERQVELSKLDSTYGKARVTSPRLSIHLDKSVTVNGALKVSDLQLKGLLTNVGEGDAPVLARISGDIDVEGTLYPDFHLMGQVNLGVKDFSVVDNEKDWVRTPSNHIIDISTADVKGTLNVYPDRLDFQALMNVLGGKGFGEGIVNFGEDAKIRVRTEKTSLTKLSPIVDLKLGGDADVLAEIEVYKGDTKISGSFSVTNSSIESVQLGDLKGLAHFENALLSFEDLRLPTSLDPVNGSGYVDFRNRTHYHFRAQARRIEVDRLFSVFSKMELPFPSPTQGEVSTNLTIEGSSGDQPITVTATGSAKGFQWYGERWLSSNFDINYSTELIEVKSLLLMKKSGGVEVKARFNSSEGSQLAFASKGLHLEELDYLGSAPLSGLVEGDVVFKGDFSAPTASGLVKITNTRFREVPMADSQVVLSSEQEGVEVYGRLLGEQLRGRWSRNETNKQLWEMLLYFEEFDLMPLLSSVMGRDIPTLTEVTATGELAVTGKGFEPESLNGSGKITELNVGLRGTPMKNDQELLVVVKQGAFQIEKFNLVGRESQLRTELKFQPGKLLEASLDGKLDLQYLQPFIPGLDYGTGKVALGLRFSGKPPNIKLIGNVVLEDGAFRLKGLLDEFRSARVQLTLSQERISVDRFQTVVNGGNLIVEGDVGIDNFSQLKPNLRISAQKVGFRPQESLQVTMTGDYTITGNQVPYDLKGSCLISKGSLTQLSVSESAPESDPIFKLDVSCQAEEGLSVKTDIINAEFKGDFHVLGDTNDIGLIGTAESIRGSLFFRETPFALRTATVRFESPNSIQPRFNVAGQARVRETSASSGNVLQEYDVNLQVIGTPQDYKIKLTSSPALEENDIISLLVLGVTRGGQQGSYVDFGAAIMGEIPFQSALKRQTGLDIKIGNAQNGVGALGTSYANTGTAGAVSGITTPQLEAEMGLTDRTKITYSNTIESNPQRAVVVEHQLGDNFTVNGSVRDLKTSTKDTSSQQTYGVDFRYKFKFK